MALVFQTILFPKCQRLEAFHHSSGCKAISIGLLALHHCGFDLKQWREMSCKRLGLNCHSKHHTAILNHTLQWNSYFQMWWTKSIYTGATLGLYLSMLNCAIELLKTIMHSPNFPNGYALSQIIVSLQIDASHQATLPSMGRFWSGCLSASKQTPATIQKL